MSIELKSRAGLTLDARRNRIRIYRQTLYGIGDPAYVQFLVNPEELYIAVLGLDKPIIGGSANKVPPHTEGYRKIQSVEFYSSTMVKRLLEVTHFDLNYSYKLTGEIDQVNRVAYFSFKTAKQVAFRRLHGTEGI